MKLISSVIAFCTVSAGPAFAGGAVSVAPVAPMATTSGGGSDGGLVLLVIVGTLLVLNGFNNQNNTNVSSRNYSPDQADDADESPSLMKF